MLFRPKLFCCLYLTSLVLFKKYMLQDMELKKYFISNCGKYHGRLSIRSVIFWDTGST